MTSPNGHKERGKRKIPRGRVKLVEKMYFDGHDPRWIQTAVGERWNCSRRTVRKDIARLEAILAAMPKPTDEAVYHRVAAMFLKGYRVAKRGGVNGPNPGAMVNATVRFAQLHGLLGERLEITRKDPPNLAGLTDDELVTYRALQRKVVAT